MTKSSCRNLRQPYRVSRSVNDEFVFNFLSGIGSPRALAVWLMYESGEHTQLVDLDINPLDYPDGLNFRDDYAATLFLRKSRFLKTDIDLEAVAMKKFKAAEEQCRVVNRRFGHLSSDPKYLGQTSSILFGASRKIEKCLSRFDPEEFVDNANWGPGTTSSLKSLDTSRVNKFHVDHGITQRCLSFVSPWLETAYPSWRREYPALDVVAGSKVLFVDKDCRSKRTIAEEPGINSFLQKGVGKMIRRRLQKVGINLNDQSVNQRAAHKASIDGLQATIDFSSASDTIAKEAVRFLFQWSPVWLSVMESLRSEVGVYGKEIIQFEKFSSMGNGFTFELESLIFWSVAAATCDYLQIYPDVSVYGDDVLLPCTAVPVFQSVCEYLGFTINRQKSFTDGYFRESCGVHYWAGLNCQPYYLKERIDDVPRVYRAANAVKKLAHRRNGDSYHCGCDVRFRRCVQHLRRTVPAYLRLAVPYTLGDVGFITDFDEACPTRSTKPERVGWEGWSVKCLAVRAVEQTVDHPGLLLARIWDRSVENGYGNSYPLRGRTRLGIIRVDVPQWQNLGPWV